MRLSLILTIRISLEDVVGEGWTMEKLLDSGVFKTMWEWLPADGDWIEDELEYIREYHSVESLSEYARSVTDSCNNRLI